ncbi:MAG: hypothetical protein ACRYHC_06310 [Janthinobacterium lividum]
MAKLKVFRTPIGFHDAYVAATSRKAALAAWGSNADLFARGVAEEVTDAALTAEPLAAPGTVIRRSRGTAAEQLAALPPDPVRESRAQPDEPEPRRPAKARRGGRGPAIPPTPVPARRPAPEPPRPPRPSPDALDAAEAALAAARDRHRVALADLAERERHLAQERRALEATQDGEAGELEQARDAARASYDAGLRRWRGWGRAES